MNPSIRHLRAFLHLADEQNFTKAARAFHLSQPAFSALIGALESGLGLRLFDRNTRSVALTVDGKTFVETARRVVRDFDAALAGVRDQTAMRRGRVAFALLPSLAAGWLPPVLSVFRRAYPGIELEVMDVLSDVCISRVASGQADFAIAASSTNTPLLQTIEFCSDGFYLICPTGHPLATAARIQISDLAKWPFVQLARTSSVRQHLNSAIQPIQMQTLMEVEQLATVMGMVRAGLGISVVPGLTLLQFDQPGIIIRKLKLGGARRTLFLVRSRERGLSVAAQGLYDLMHNMRPSADALLRPIRVDKPKTKSDG